MQSSRRLRLGLARKSMSKVVKEVYTTRRTSFYPSYPDQRSDCGCPREKKVVSNAKQMKGQVKKEKKRVRTGRKRNSKERVD